MARALRCGRALLAAWIVTAAVGCSRNPATGRLQFGLPSDAEEITLGRDADVKVREVFGQYDEVPSAVQIVRGTGTKVAAVSERPGLPWTFTLLDDPQVNAFALPGGYVYVTRGLLAHLATTDELAGVLAHEAGHVTARHGVVQLRKQNTARRSVGLFRVIDPELRHVGGFAARTAGLALLRYSREDEHEADDLAVRYVTAGGWSTAALVRVFDVLVSLPTDGGKEPAWLSTHPDPALRRARTAGTLGIAEVQPVVPQPEYLAAIAGIAFGDDPRDGYLSGSTFVHPRMGFVVDLPPKWKILHDRAQVVGISDDDVAVFVTMPTKYESAKAALTDFFADGSMSAGESFVGKVGGFAVESRAFAMAGDDGGTLMGLVAFVEHGKRVMAMIAIGPEAGWVARSEILALSFASFRGLTDPRLAAVEPLRIAAVKIDGETTLESLVTSRRLAVDAATLGRLNGVAATATLAAGTVLKLPLPRAK